MTTLNRFDSILLLVLLLTISCTNSSKSDLIFKLEYSLEGNQILLEDVNINQLFTIDNYLFGHQYKGEYYFKIFDIENLSEIGELCRRGNGPNEFPFYLMLNQHYTDNSEVCIWVHDLTVGRLTKINVTQSLRDNETIVLREIPTRPQSAFYNAFVIDSSLIVGRSTNSIINMNRLQLYNPIDDSIIRTISLFPKVDVNQSKDDINFTMLKYNPLFVSSIGLKPDKSKIASAMTSFNRVDIFDINGDVYKSIIEGPDVPDYLKKYLNAVEDNSESSLQYFYNSIFTSNNFIYALYVGQELSEYGQKPLPTQLRIFDWEGNPMAKINLNDYLINFTIDEDRGVMFGVDHYNEKLLQYDIKELVDALHQIKI